MTYIPFYLGILIYSYLAKNSFYYKTILILSLSSIAVIFSYNYAPDTINYRGLANKFTFNDLTFSAQWANIEPGYIFISAFFNALDIHYVWVFWLVSLIAISIKINLITSFKEGHFYILLAYISYFFILHEMTQMRISVGIAFAIYAIKNMSDNKYFRGNLILLVGSLFHYSVLGILIFNIFKIYKPSITTMWFVLIIILISTLIFEFSYREFTEYYLRYLPFFERYAIYKFENLGTATLFRPKFLLIFFIIIIFTIIYNMQRDKISKFQLFCFYSIFISLYIYMIFYDIQQVQVRMSELFLFPVIFLMPLIRNSFKQKKLVSLLIIISFILFTYYYTNYTINFYDRNIENYLPSDFR